MHFRNNMRFSLYIIALVATLGLAAGCPHKGGPAAPPQSTTAFSAELGIRLTYSPEEFSSISSTGGNEFPLTFTGKDYKLGIKRIGNVGILLQKEPQADFFKFFAQQVRFDMVDRDKLTPIGQEVDEEFQAQGKPGLRQVLHFTIPKDISSLPEYLPKEPGKEIWIYYHHFYYKPDYYFFVAISDQQLDKAKLDGIVSLINSAQFQAQPLPGGK